MAKALKIIIMKDGGNDRRALVVREDETSFYVRFWDRQQSAWRVDGPKSGNRVPKANLVRVESDGE